MYVEYSLRSSYQYEGDKIMPFFKITLDAGFLTDLKFTIARFQA